MRVFLLLVETTLESFISRLATGTYTLGGMYVPMYTCTRRFWIEIGRCSCSDVMDWDYVSPRGRDGEKRRNKVHEPRYLVITTNNNNVTKATTTCGKKLVIMQLVHFRW